MNIIYLIKEKEDYKLLKMPYKIYYYNKLSGIHKSKGHCSFKLLVKELYKSGYSYKGIYSDSKIIINSCIVLIKKKNFYKIEKTK